MFPSSYFPVAYWTDKYWPRQSTQQAAAGGRGFRGAGLALLLAARNDAWVREQQQRIQAQLQARLLAHELEYRLEQARQKSLVEQSIYSVLLSEI